MKLVTYAGAVVDSDEGWYRVAECVLGHLRRSAFVMLGERNEDKIDAFCNGVVVVLDGLREIHDALRVPWR